MSDSPVRHLNLTGANANHNFDINEGTADPDTAVFGTVTATGDVTKIGNGKLQLSGVGNASELEPFGSVVHDLPGVGENLQDHLEVYVQYSSKLPVSVAPAMKWRNRPAVGLRWLLFRDGPGATNHFEAGGFIRSTERTWCSMISRRTGKMCRSVARSSVYSR